MVGSAVFRSGLVFAGFLLGACSVAQAKIPPAQQAIGTAPDFADSNVLSEYLSRSASAPVQDNSDATNTITLNFGPLHFREVFKTTPKTCRS